MHTSPRYFSPVTYISHFILISFSVCHVVFFRFSVFLLFHKSAAWLSTVALSVLAQFSHVWQHCNYIFKHKCLLQTTFYVEFSVTEKLWHRNTDLASSCMFSMFLSVWESSMITTLVVFSQVTTITWMLPPGCKQVKAQRATGVKLHIVFSLLWCSSEAGSDLYQSMDSFLPCPQRLAPAWFLNFCVFLWFQYYRVWGEHAKWVFICWFLG